LVPVMVQVFVELLPTSVSTPRRWGEELNKAAISTMVAVPVPFDRPIMRLAIEEGEANVKKSLLNRSRLLVPLSEVPPRLIA